MPHPVYVNRQLMTRESNVASIDYQIPIVRSLISECDVALERYRNLNIEPLLVQQLLKPAMATCQFIQGFYTQIIKVHTMSY